MVFKGLFNKAIEGVKWPASLRRLTFGTSFNQRIDKVAWPPLMEKVTP